MFAVKGKDSGTIKAFADELPKHQAVPEQIKEIQEIKRRARGFRNIDNFITMIYLEAAGLKLELPT